MKKAPLLSDEEIQEWMVANKSVAPETVKLILPPLNWSLEAQRDADHKYYQDKIRGALLTEEERDNCTPTDEQLEDYLNEPDDEVARKLRLEYPEIFKIEGNYLLYGRNIAQAQIQKILDS